MNKYRPLKRYSSNKSYSMKTKLKIGISAVLVTGIFTYQGCQMNTEIKELKENHHHITNSSLETRINNYK